MPKNHSQVTRRTVLKTSGILAISSISATGLGSSQQYSTLKIEQYPEGEYVEITNNYPERDSNLTGFSINFEAGEDSEVNQIRELAGDVVIPAGESITVPTGARDVEADNIVELVDPYEDEVLRNDGSDVVTLLDTDEQVVVSTADNVTYTLSLTVIGPDEEPVADAGVGIVTYDAGVPVTSGTTDENGQATFELRNGSYAAEVAPEGYAQPSDDRGVRINGEDVERTIQLVTVPGGGPNEEDETNGDEDTTDDEPNEPNPDEDEDSGSGSENEPDSGGTSESDEPADDGSSDDESDDEDYPDEKDADGDGVVASEDADDNCAKIQ